MLVLSIAARKLNKEDTVGASIVSQLKKPQPGLHVGIGTLLGGPWDLVTS